MSEALKNSRDTAHGDSGNEPVEFIFDPSESGTPSLRPPKLGEAGLQAAIQYGFSETYLPSSVTGGDRNVMERSNNRQPATATSMSNNHSNSNSNQYNSGSNQQHNQSPLFVDNYNLGLTQEQLEGLLPGLSRPDINQIPPDVLAVLLKSSRFEEIIIPTQRRLTESANAQLQQQQQQQQQQRNNSEGYNSVGGGPPSFTNNNSGGTPRAVLDAQQQQQSSKVKFSPLAKEFVPTSFQSSSMSQQQQQETADLAYAMSQVQFQDQYNPGSLQSLSDDFEGPDCILSTVTDMISQVSQEPASLNRCVKTTVDVLKKYLNDEDTLGIVVTLLTEQMISNDNFCYSGAKILEAFRKNQIEVNKKGIKPLLLNRMKEEFDHCLNNIRDPEVRIRALGVLRLLSELYMNFGLLANNSKLQIFGLAVLELMQKLLQNDRTLQVVRCVCQLLKLVGYDIAGKSQDERMQGLYNSVMEELKRIRTSSEIHPSCVSLIDMVFKLHSNKWNQEQEGGSSASTSHPSSVPKYAPPPSHPVYYELPDSDDDQYFDDSIYIDNEGEDVQEAYEEFLKMTSNQTNKK